MIEGRRYRHLHHAKWRVFVLESGFFAEALQPDSDRSLPDWRRLLASDLRHAHLRISWLLGIRVRLRRNYTTLVEFLTSVWMVKLYIHPAKSDSFTTPYSRLRVGNFIPSWFVALSALAFVAASTALAVTCPTAERLED